MLKHGILLNDTKTRYEAWRHGTMIGTCSSGCKEATLRIWKERYLKYIEMEWNEGCRIYTETYCKGR